MSTLNDQIIAVIKSEFVKTSEQMMAQAKEAIGTMQHNLSIKEIGDHDYQVNQTIAHVKGFKDSAILDETQGNVLCRFTKDDEQIEDLEVYDESCDLRSQYQSELESDIDNMIESLEMHLTKYVVFQNYDDEDDGEYIDYFNTIEEAEGKIKRNIEQYNEDADEYSILKAQLISVDFNEADDGSDDADPNYDTTIIAKIDDEAQEAVFCVQLNDGYYMPQMGCWITTGNGDGEFSNLERLVFECYEVAELTSAHARSVMKDRFKYHNTGFNCAINNVSVYILEDTQDNSFSLAAVDDCFNSNNYGTKSSKTYWRYRTLEEAQAFCDEYKTGEYHDFSGLAKLLDTINQNSY